MAPGLCYFAVLYAPLKPFLFSYLITDASINPSSQRYFAYLDVGHAEAWRDYWPGLSPELLLGESHWPGEYYVKFWDPEWVKLMRLEVAKIANRGFGGIFLDNLDACLNVTWANPRACGEMAELVSSLARYAESLGLKVIVNLGAVAYMGPELPVYGVLREETLCPFDDEAWRYLEEARSKGKVAIALEYNVSEPCYERALWAASRGVYVYLAPSAELDEPSPYCIEEVSAPALLSLFFLRGRRGWAGSDPPRAHRTPGLGASKRGTGVRGR
ncbi:MAG: endo alpha-1,4 polygalactosaminidase [Crenarchaeota archaeon]|nr:endo alpha-1,4 polygalactosaminidase [Thermoproteota archaeon]